LIPKTRLYNTTVDPLNTMADVTKLLTKFGITQKRLTQAGPENSFFEFIIQRPKDVSLLIKIKIPFIEKKTKQ